MRELDCSLRSIQQCVERFFSEGGAPHLRLRIGGETVDLFSSPSTLRCKLGGLALDAAPPASPAAYQFFVVCLPELMKLVPLIEEVLTHLSRVTEPWASPHYTLDWSGDRVSFIDLAARRSYCVYFSSDLQTAKPLDPELRMTFALLGKFLVHAAAYTKDDRCLLTFGESGAGKSHSTLAALGSGWKVLGDDRVLLSRSENGVSLYSVFDTVSFAGNTGLTPLKVVEGKTVYTVPEKALGRAFLGPRLRAVWLHDSDKPPPSTSNICLKVAADLTHETLYYRRNYAHFNFLVPALLKLMRELGPAPVTRAALAREIIEGNT